MGNTNYQYSPPQRNRKRHLVLGFLVFLLIIVIPGFILLTRTFFWKAQLKSKGEARRTDVYGQKRLQNEDIRKINSENLTAENAPGPEEDELLGIIVSPKLLSYYQRLSLGKEQNITEILTTLPGRSSLDENLKPEEKATKAAILLGRYWEIIVKNLPKFSEGDISDSLLSIREESSPEDIRTYFNSVAEVYETFAPVLIDKEENILKEAQKSGRRPVELAEVRKTLQKMKERILKIDTPRKILIFHKKELWGLENHIIQVAILETISPSEDPLYFTLIAKIREHLKREMAILHAEKIPGWLRGEGIIFSSEDKAPKLYTGIAQLQ